MSQFYDGLYNLLVFGFLAAIAYLAWYGWSWYSKTPRAHVQKRTRQLMTVPQLLEPASPGKDPSLRFRFQVVKRQGDYEEWLCQLKSGCAPDFMSVAAKYITVPLGARSATWIPDPHNGSLGLLSLTFGPPRVAPARESFLGSPYAPNQLGWDVSGTQPVSIDIGQASHILICGPTGTGKSVFIRNYICARLLEGVPTQPIFFDLKQSEFGTLDGEVPGVKVATDYEQAEALLEKVRAEMKSRQAFMKEQRKRNPDVVMDVYPISPSKPRLMVVVDEASELFASGTPEAKKRSERIGEHLTSLARLGRSAGIELVVGLQRADVRNLGPSGGDFRDNLAGRVLLGAASRTSLEMMFSGEDTKNCRIDDSSVKGQAHASSLVKSNGRVMRVPEPIIVPFTSKDVLVEALVRADALVDHSEDASNFDPDGL